MGITGLIPFLEKSSKKVNISEYSGCTVAIDTYCWLHKGAFSCADKILLGQKTDAYVKYCMRYVNMLLSLKIKPILVFDGRHLPAKAETEIKRRESRDSNRKRAAELIKMGKVYEGKNLLRRCLDVSHKMALEVMKECQAQNVDCITAPYEADAQLAYLNICGIADIVITEDSDLTLFGCKKIMFKMDLCGYGVLVEQESLHLAMGLSKDDFSLDKFRYMCILSGCDYLPSLPGIGLAKACKFVVKNRDPDIYNALVRLASVLNMKALVVTKEYRDAFLKAFVTFKHQLVFCPLERKQKRLYPSTVDVTEEQLKYAGNEVDHELAMQLALGNCDPFTFEKLHDFNPDNPQHQRKTNSWSESAKVPTHLSIWSNQFMVHKSEATPKNKMKSLPKAGSRGKTVMLNTDQLKSKTSPRKRLYQEAEVTTDDLIAMYQPEIKKPSLLLDENEDHTDDEKISPIIVKRANPFKKSDSSPDVCNRIRRRLPVRGFKIQPTVINENETCQSKFFHSKPTRTTESNMKQEPEKENNLGSKDKVLKINNEEPDVLQIDKGETEVSLIEDRQKPESDIGIFHHSEKLDISENLKPTNVEEKIENKTSKLYISENKRLLEIDGYSDFEQESFCQQKRIKNDSMIEESRYFSNKTKQPFRPIIAKPVKKGTSKKNTIIPGQQTLFGFGIKNV